MYRRILSLLTVCVVTLFCGPGLAASAAGPLHAGAASTVITPPAGSWQQGAGVTKRGDRIRDELEANALYLKRGDTQLLLLSCDLVGLNLKDIVPMRDAISAETGVPPRNVLITCTHTHSGPVLFKTNYHLPVDREYIDGLGPKLAAVSREAVEKAGPAEIGWGMGEAQIGYNRRVCWSDGTHSMHGDTGREDFAGLEGPDDPAHLALFLRDANGAPLAVAYHNTSHPTTFYGAGLFSADYPGVARDILRRELGAIPVLYFNGAQGDINMNNLLDPTREDREARMERIGTMLAEETLKLYEDAVFHDGVQLGHAFEDLEVGVRLPDAEKLAEARAVMERVDSGEEIRGMEGILAFGTVHLQDTYANRPTDTLPVHAIRIGDVALVTQPCELYCQFGLDIKRRSPAKHTAIIGLADGYCGYCPTIAGILGGGYSGAPISWTRLEPYAGYKIVEAAGPMLNRLWRD